MKKNKREYGRFDVRVSVTKMEKEHDVNIGGTKSRKKDSGVSDGKI